MSERLTERHCGVAVIRDKNLLKEAMEKLARYEEMEAEWKEKKETGELTNLEAMILNLWEMRENSQNEEDEMPWMDEFGGWLTWRVDCHPVFKDGPPCLNEERNTEYQTMEWHENCQECKYDWLMRKYE